MQVEPHVVPLNYNELSQQVLVYNGRGIIIKHGMYTPIVFETNGGMGNESSLFIKELDTKFAFKQSGNY